MPPSLLETMEMMAVHMGALHFPDCHLHIPPPRQFFEPCLESIERAFIAVSFVFP
jgi:hypothetical protein